MDEFTLSSGHSAFVRGASRYIDEVDEARKVTNAVAGYLKDLGCSVNIFHDNTSRTQRDNINTIVRYHNGTKRDLDISIHFNAHEITNAPKGVEVCYLTQGSLAARISKGISSVSGLKDRGGKYRTNLGFLNNTSKPSILIEVCFVDSQEDVRLYKTNFDKICRSIAETLSGEKLPVIAPAASPTKTEAASKETPGTFRIYTGSFGSGADAEAAAAAGAKAIIGIGYHAFPKESRIWTGPFGTLEQARIGQAKISDEFGFNPKIRDMNTGKDVI